MAAVDGTRRTLRRRAALAGLAAGAALALAPSALATFPGDNGAIAFVRGGDIYTVAQNGTGERQLTSGPAVDGSPEWAPDGREIFFDRDGDIWRMKPDGTGAAKVLEGGVDPQFSGDGKQIAYYDGSSASPIMYVANRDGSNPVEVEENDNLVRVDDWAPTHSLILHTFHDGDSLFTARSPMGSQINWGYLHDDRHFSNSGPSWSPDGTRIVFATSPSGLSPVCFGEPTCPDPDVGIRTMDLGGGELKTVHQGSGQTPAWSPDGKRIVFRATSGQLQIVHPDGTGKRTLVAGAEPDWQPVEPKVPEPDVRIVPGLERIVTVPGPERVVVRTTTVPGAVEKCDIPAGRRKLSLTIRVTRAVKAGARVKITVDLANGKVKVPRGKPFRVVAR